jgi:hypothetical protein
MELELGQNLHFSNVSNAPFSLLTPPLLPDILKWHPGRKEFKKPI